VKIPTSICVRQPPSGRSATRLRSRPNWGMTDRHVAADGWFALVFHLAGDHAAAAERFDATADLPTELPWGYYRDAARAYGQYRAKAYRAAGRT
jgi:hypothetical protein